MTCKELADFLDDYLAQTLESSRRAIFDEHLTQCPDCRAYLDSYRKTIELERGAMRNSGAATDAQVPAGLIQAVLASRSAK